jgi:hypothetical protein
MLSPQQRALPSVPAPQVNELPPRTVAIVTPVTMTAVGRLVVVPSPIWPCVLFPQHRSTPVAPTSPQLWEVPSPTAESVKVPGVPVIAAGDFEHGRLAAQMSELVKPSWP